MDEGDKEKMSAIEKLALNILAIGVGFFVAFVAWGLLFNLFVYHSLFQPQHPAADGVDLGGGFVLIATLPVLFILLPVCDHKSLAL